MHLKTKSFILLLLLFSTTILAQVEINDSINLNEVLVTGAKTESPKNTIPLSVSQVTQQNIENSGQINVLPALNAYVPGIFVTERSLLGFGVAVGGSGAITIRGISSQPNTSVLILIDGHPQYQGIFGHPISDAYVASDVEKVEVIRGPASILYGSNAMAGVINLITKKQSSEGLKLSTGVSYGSHNTQKYYGTIGYKKNKWNVFASANHDRTDGMRDNTDFQISNGYFKTGYLFNEHFKLNADVSLAQYNANDNGPVFAPDSFNIDITRGKAALSFENQFEHMDGSLKVYHNFGEHLLSDGFHSTDYNSGLMLYETFRFSDRNSISTGFDLKQYGGIANRGAAANELKRITETALYTYTQQSLSDKVKLNGGLRFEHNSVYGNEIVPMIGLSYIHSHNTSFKASASKGFRSPTVMELYLYAANDSLQPERMMSYEISWLQTAFDNKLQTELTLFMANGENIIQVVPYMPPIRKNVGTFNNKGVEVSAKYLITNYLTLHGNYSFVDLETPVLAAPRQQANLSLNFRRKYWSINVSAQHINKLYTSITPEITESYTLLNVRLTANPHKMVELFVMGNNLLNQQYEINYGYPMPGVYFNAGVNIRY